MRGYIRGHIPPTCISTPTLFQGTRKTGNLGDRKCIMYVYVTPRPGSQSQSIWEDFIVIFITAHALAVTFALHFHPPKCTISFPGFFGRSNRTWQTHRKGKVFQRCVGHLEPKHAAKQNQGCTLKSSEPEKYTLTLWSCMAFKNFSGSNRCWTTSLAPWCKPEPIITSWP